MYYCITYLFASHVCKYCTCTLFSCQLPDELAKSKTGPCRDLTALSFLIYNRHGFRISFVLTAMAVTGLCPITFAYIYIDARVDINTKDKHFY